MATHSSILAWKIPCTEEPGSPWGCKESDTTEHVRVPVHTCTRAHTHTRTHTHHLPGLDDEGKLSPIASTPLLLLLSRFSRV